jgi:hypothetical protein
MAKIKGWKKKINKPNRIFWENNDLDMIVNVEKINKIWYLTKGSKKGQQVTDNIKTKEEAISRAIGYMKFHSENGEMKEPDNYLFGNELGL